MTTHMIGVPLPFGFCAGCIAAGHRVQATTIAGGMAACDRHVFVHIATPVVGGPEQALHQLGVADREAGGGDPPAEDWR